MLFASVLSPVFAGSGFGAHPISDRVASHWVTQKDGKGKLRFVLVYYVGDAGWHDVKWSIKGESGAYHKLISDDLVLSVEISRNGKKVIVQGHESRYRDGNVFLVSGTFSEPEEIVSLGRFDAPEVIDLLGLRMLLDHPDLAARGGVDPSTLRLPRKLDLIAIASGRWGFEVEGASCADNPHTISFTPDGRSMELRYARDAEGGVPDATVYQLVMLTNGFIRMKKVGESEFAENGEPVLWDLVLLSQDSYCWHRSDWHEDACTQPATRCAGTP